jgi:hypothetical protein
MRLILLVSSGLLNVGESYCLVCRSSLSDRCLLRIWEELPTFKKEEWSSVLSLAHKWDFARIRALAIQNLSPITTAVDKIILSDTFQIESWKANAYRRICEQTEWPSLEDCRRLGVDIVCKIGQARQALQASPSLIPDDLREAIISRTFFPSHPEDGYVSPSVGDWVEPRTTSVPSMAASSSENNAISTTTPGVGGPSLRNGLASNDSREEYIASHTDEVTQDNSSALKPIATPGVVATSGAKSTDPLDAATTELRYYS